MSYLPCELHCHTLHSDGDFSVKELQEAAKENHLSLIALTDHNTMSGWDELDDSVVPAIRGIEWTTYLVSTYQAYSFVTGLPHLG